LKSFIAFLLASLLVAVSLTTPPPLVRASAVDNLWAVIISGFIPPYPISVTENIEETASDFSA